MKRDPRTRRIQFSLTKREYEILFNAYFAECKNPPPSFPIFSQGFGDWIRKTILSGVDPENNKPTSNQTPVEAKTWSVSRRTPVLKHEGLHSRRLEPSQNNPREIAFAEQWKHENEISHVLSALLSRQEGGHPFMPFTGTHVQLAPCDQHAASVAATVIQWLGSNVGMCFLEESLRPCGFRITEDRRPAPETVPTPPLIGESFADKIARLELMADGDPTWNLNYNDRAAIRTLLEKYQELRALVASLEKDLGSAQFADKWATAWADYHRRKRICQCGAIGEHECAGIDGI